MGLTSESGYSRRGGGSTGGTGFVPDVDALARLNAHLGLGLRFELGTEESTGSLPGPRILSGILEHRPVRGRRRTATFPVVHSAERRRFLLSVAGSLAECAMDLGLGAGVYHAAAFGSTLP
jgi:hypothetical protein